MKKIPTVFVREYKDHKVVGIKNEFTSENTKYAFEHGVPTVKFDGSCCAIIDGELYKRYDAKKGKTPHQSQRNGKVQTVRAWQGDLQAQV